MPVKYMGKIIHYHSPTKRNKQRVLTPGHQGWNDLHSLCRIGMEYYLLNDNNNDTTTTSTTTNNNNDNNNNDDDDDNNNDNNNKMIIMTMPRDVSSHMWHSLQ